MNAVRVRLNGEVFSDLGRASSFMALDWVQGAATAAVGFVPFAATLNVRPLSGEDQRRWDGLRVSVGIPLRIAESGYCSARLYPVEIEAAARKVGGAVLLPEVPDYPADKIEVIAPVRLKDALGIRDGDRVTLEFTR